MVRGMLLIWAGMKLNYLESRPIEKTKTKKIYIHIYVYITISACLAAQLRTTKSLVNYIDLGSLIHVGPPFFIFLSTSCASADIRRIGEGPFKGLLIFFCSSFPSEILLHTSFFQSLPRRLVLSECLYSNS